VAALATRVTVVFDPKWGPQFAVRFHVAPGIVDPNNAGIQAIVTAINALTRSIALTIELSAVDAIAGSPTASATYIAEDKAAFKALDADGQVHNYRVPGPMASIFNADKETVNFAAGGVGSFISRMLAAALGRGGVPITSIPNGFRAENRKMLKSAPQI
jgi:hypothetical protein